MHGILGMRNALRVAKTGPTAFIALFRPKLKKGGWTSIAAGKLRPNCCIARVMDIREWATQPTGSKLKLKQINEWINALQLVYKSSWIWKGVGRLPLTLCRLQIEWRCSVASQSSHRILVITKRSGVNTVKAVCFNVIITLIIWSTQVSRLLANSIEWFTSLQRCCCYFSSSFILTHWHCDGTILPTKTPSKGHIFTACCSDFWKKKAIKTTRNC